MGLELGPPWLVVIFVANDSFEVLYKDNFTGAGFDRVKRVLRDELGSVSAVLGKNGGIALREDGEIFQPIAEMKGRNFGTSAERGHRAYLVGCRLLGESRLPFASADSTNDWFRKLLLWPFIILVVLALLGALAK